MGKTDGSMRLTKGHRGRKKGYKPPKCERQRSCAGPVQKEWELSQFVGGCSDNSKISARAITLLSERKKPAKYLRCQSCVQEICEICVAANAFQPFDDICIRC